MKMSISYPTDARAQELERLKKIYSLFKFNMDRDGHLTIEMPGGSSFHTIVDQWGRLDRESELHLNHDHMEKAIAAKFMEQYPDLLISAYGGKDGVVLSAWVKRDGRGAEAVGDIGITDPDLRIHFRRWQDEAGQAKEEGWFFCSGHVRAEQKAIYDYYYFAGQYCKEYGEQHPAHRREAASETYE